MPAPAVPHATRSALLVSAARVITSPSQRPLDHHAVLAEDGVITAIGPSAELATARPDVERLDFPGATVIPGLINAHAHLCFDVTTDPRHALEAGDVTAVRRTVEENAVAVLDGGVTTVRDLGDLDGLLLGFRADVEVGATLGPRVLTAMSPLTPPNGHCWFLGGELDTEPSGSEESRRAIRSAVDRRGDAGADVIKVMASGGNLTPAGARMWETQFSQDDLDTIVAAAHERGLPVAGHAHGVEAMARCGRAGVDTIEHGSWRVEPGADGAPAYDMSDDVADLIAASGAVVVPTRSRGWPSWPPEARLDLQLEQLAWAAGRGITMIAGNDAGVGRGRFDDLTDAVSLFGAAGWSNAEALATATTTAAQVLGRADRLGRLAVGYAADLVVLDADPLEDLRALERVRFVLAGRSRHRPASR